MGVSSTVTRATDEGPVLLFDGICNLCNGAVQFIIRRDRAGRIRFAPLQSAAAEALLDGLTRDLQTLSDSVGSGVWDSVICIDRGKTFTKSDALFHIAPYLRMPWPLIRILAIVPRPLRNALYDAIANRRYRLFGRRSTCMVPDDNLKQRFLE